jgi:hypothetical protein
MSEDNRLSIQHVVVDLAANVFGEPMGDRVRVSLDEASDTATITIDLRGMQPRPALRNVHSVHEAIARAARRVSITFIGGGS